MAGAPSALAQTLRHSLSSRTISVKCTPTPRNLFERRAVLRAIQNQSSDPIETFRCREDNSYFVAITTKPEAATALVNESPFTRTIITQQEGTREKDASKAHLSSWGSEFDMRQLAGPFTAPVNPYPANKSTQPTASSEDLGITHKTFTLHIYPGEKDFPHKDVIRNSILHGPWPGDNSTRSFVSTALMSSIPKSALAPALRDWHTGYQNLPDYTSATKERAEGAASTLLKHNRFSQTEANFLERLRQKENGRKVPAIMKSLDDFATHAVDPSAPTSDSETTTPPNGPAGTGASPDSEDWAIHPRTPGMQLEESGPQKPVPIWEPAIKWWPEETDPPQTQPKPKAADMNYIMDKSAFTSEMLGAEPPKHEPKTRFTTKTKEKASF